MQKYTKKVDRNIFKKNVESNWLIYSKTIRSKGQAETADGKRKQRVASVILTMLMATPNTNRLFSD